NWVLATPPGWFATAVSFLVPLPAAPLLQGVFVAASFFTLAFLYWMLTRLSPGFVESLVEGQATGESAASGRSKPRAYRPLPLNAYLPSRSQRAMFRLVFTYLWRDPKLRLGVLSLSVVFLFSLIVLSSNLQLDPGANVPDRSVYAAVRDLERFLYCFTAYFILTLANFFIFHFRYSDHFKAAWIYYISPARPSELFIGTLKAVTAFIVPFALAADLVFFIRLTEPLRMMQDLIILLLLLLIMEAAWMAVNPGYPFSEAPQSSRASLKTAAITLGIPTAAFAAWYFMRQVLDGASLVVFAAEAILLVGALFVVWKWLDARVKSVLLDVEV
ncbi:MAG: hypothetical protein ACREJQ_05350, partial [bacterium]